MQRVFAAARLANRSDPLGDASITGFDGSSRVIGNVDLLGYHFWRLGRFFAASRGRVRGIAGRLGVHRLAKLSGCPA